jgi:hypothetical protein
MGKQSQWKVIAGTLTYKVKTYIPEVNSVHDNVISLFHDNLESGHFGSL